MPQKQSKTLPDGAAGAGDARETDAQLVRLAQNGDKQAEEQLLRRYKKEALAFSRAYFLAGADREDALQECMIGLFRAIRTYSPAEGASFHTFAGICMERAMISAVRASGRQKNRALNESLSLDAPAIGQDGERASLLDAIPAPPDTEKDPDRDVLERMEARLRLSALEKAVWQELRAGRTVREAAEVLGRTPKSVDNAVQRIRQKIRACGRDAAE